MHLLVTGATGLLGRALVRRLPDLLPCTVRGAGWTRAQPPILRLDLRDERALEACLEAEHPDAVIHAAAERRPERVEQDPAGAEALNVTATASLASACAARGIPLSYISTDYVFDGTHPPYAPEDAPNPLNAYGRSKLAGEWALQAAFGPAGPWTVLRVPILYGPTEDLGESAVTELAQHLLADRRGPVDAWARRYPTHVDDVALALATLLQAGSQGIHHLPPQEACTKADMARLCATLLNLDPSGIEDDPEPPKGALRPQDVRLDGQRLLDLGFRRGVPFEVGLAQVLRPWRR